MHVTDTFEGVVDTPASHLNDHLLDRLFVIFWIHTVGSAKRTGQFELGRVGVDSDDASCLGLTRTLNRRQTDAAQAKYRDCVARLDFGRVVHRANAGSHAAAEQADVLGVGVWIDLRDRNFSDNSVLAEGRATHVVVQGLAVVGEA